jgi:hypothetical protein
MRSRALLLLSPLSAGLALAALAAVLASGAACERACKPGTLFLDVDLGSSRGADTLEVDVTVAGGAAKHTTRPLTGGPSSGTLEIDFPSGYPDGKRVDIEMVATKSGTTLGSIAVSVTLASSCTHATIVFPGGGGSGAGGSSATTGAGGSSATTGAGGSSATTGAGGSAGGSGGSGSGTGGATATGGTSGVIALVPDSVGYVQNTTLGLMGPWYAFSDGIGLDNTTASGDCELKGGNPYSACSQVSTPSPGSFPPSDATTAKMCTAGTVAKVISDTASTLDYSNIWGAGIGLDFNHVAGDSARGVYDAPGHKVLGVSFNIDRVPAGGVRVTFPTSNTITTPPIWMANAVANYTSPLVVGYNEVRWAQVMSPGYATNPPAFDPTLLVGINFHVPTTTTASQSYSFCISNLSFILGP